MDNRIRNNGPSGFPSEEDEINEVNLRYIFNDPYYSDEEDEAIFGVRLWHHYGNLFRPIKHNHFKENIYSFSDIPSGTPACFWSRIGTYIGKNSHIEWLYLRNANLTPETLEALMMKLRANTSIKSFYLDGNREIGSHEGMSVLSRNFLEGNGVLTELSLKSVGMDQMGFQVLVWGLMRSGVRNLTLSDNPEENWLNASIFYLDKLVTLDLSRSGIGRDDCNALSYLLGNPQSRLKHLTLDSNPIDDQCCSIIASSIRENTVLENIFMNENRDITLDGWRHFLTLICDKSSIEGTYLSNITLRGVHGAADSTYEEVRHDFMNLMFHLKDISIENENRYLEEKNLRRKKVKVVYFCEEIESDSDDRYNPVTKIKEDFDLRPFLDLDVKLMPYVLAWVNKHFSMREHSMFFEPSMNRFRVLYRFIRFWNIPTLFQFPSTSKLRILELEEVVKKLQGAYLNLLSEYAYVKRENRELRRRFGDVAGENDTVGL